MIEMFDANIISAINFMVILFYCRQVEPSPDNLVANSLASNIKERNVRKVKISAKVTLAIWVLETIWLVGVSTIIVLEVFICEEDFFLLYLRSFTQWVHNKSSTRSHRRHSAKFLPK